MLDRTAPDPAPGELAQPFSRPSVTPLYRAVVEQLHARIERLGIPMWKCDDLSGLQDGYTAKLLHPDTPSGRQARWETLQLLVEALYPNGYRIIIRPLDNEQTAAKLQHDVPPMIDKLARSVMRRMGRRGGLRSGEVRRRKSKLLAEERARAPSDDERAMILAPSRAAL